MSKKQLRLKKFLEECKLAYYAGNPIISDEQYDNLEEIYAEDLSVGTNRGKVKHWFPMYSLKKVYTGESPPFDKIDVIVTPKLDGAAIAIRYLKGKLHSVVTRGNGLYGDDITHLFEDKGTLASLRIPTRIDLWEPTQITGEIVAPNYIDNARNYAAGALGLKNQVLFMDKILHFYAYGVQPYPSEWYSVDMEILNHNGFISVWSDTDWNEYPTDGLVVRINKNNIFENKGYTSKHPRGAYAQKERTEGVETKILDVVWQTGKSGKVTPVAILEPVNIDGATISKATLNNPGFIEALDVSIYDKVMVERAGGIIPRIIRKVT